MITVPDQVRRSAESLGPAGRAWLAALPDLADEVCRRWSLSPGDALDGGKWAYVARVRVAGGTDAVLKVAPPTPTFAQQVDMITAAAGRGYVHLYKADPARHALLMEALGPRLSVAGQSVGQMLDVLAATLRQAWLIPWPTEAAAAPDFDVAGRLIGFLDQPWPPEDDEPCAPRLIALARTLVERRAAAYDPERRVTCHGDPHADNALAVLSPRPGAESGYVFVDPDGFRYDRAYDLGVAIRGWTDHVLAAADPVGLTREWSARLAAATDADERAVWEWGLIQRVTTGLHLMRYGHRAEGRAYLASAGRLV